MYPRNPNCARMESLESRKGSQKRVSRRDDKMLRKRREVEEEKDEKLTESTFYVDNAKTNGKCHVKDDSVIFHRLRPHYKPIGTFNCGKPIGVYYYTTDSVA
jgi:hypothetical protein